MGRWKELFRTCDLFNNGNDVFYQKVCISNHDDGDGGGHSGGRDNGNEVQLGGWPLYAEAVNEHKQVADAWQVVDAWLLVKVANIGLADAWVTLQLVIMDNTLVRLFT